MDCETRRGWQKNVGSMSMGEIWDLANRVSRELVREMYLY